MTDKILDTVTLQGLAAVFDASSRSARVARARAFEDGRETLYGTARSIGDLNGCSTPNIDFRDRYLRVTLVGGFDTYWPVAALADEFGKGYFAVDVDPPGWPKAPKPEPRYTLHEAQRELERRQCERGGHEPGTIIRDEAGNAVVARCACGQTTWSPKPTKAEPDGEMFP